MLQAILDESRLASGGSRKTLSAELAAIAKLLQRMRVKDNVDVLVHPTVWEAAVGSDLKLFNALFESGNVDDDVRELLYRELERLPQCRAGYSNSREFVEAQIAKSVPCALVVSASRAGRETLGKANAHLVGTEAGLVGFYRDAATVGDFSERDFMFNARRAYPVLYFFEDLERQIGRFSKSYRAIRPALIQALSDLNDHLPEILKVETEGGKIVRRFEAVSDFRISPESPNTHKKTAAMNKRMVTFSNVVIDGTNHGAVKLLCEWHLKFSWNKDRIHYAAKYGRIFIGIFVDHLPV